MKTEISMSAFILAAALAAPPAMAVAASPESTTMSMTTAQRDVSDLTDEELKTRMQAVTEAVKGDDARALSGALGALSASGKAVSDEQVKVIADRLRSYAKNYAKHADTLEKEIFKVENLTIGRIAPNIVGVDTDDVEFELKDYKGKVVVIDFWGDW